MSTEIKILENGPCLIAGKATYVDADGNEQTTEGKMVALCRCGASANKPFCDGAHKTAGFEASEIVLKLEA
jgi:CDGSH-type Zn-finger protein